MLQRKKKHLLDIWLQISVVAITNLLFAAVKPLYKGCVNSCEYFML